MEKIRTVVVEIDGKHVIDIGDKKETVIPISEEDANEVKRSFNKIIRRLKKGPFQLEFEETGQDLFCQVTKEYVNQLNKEIKEVYEEMKQYDLVETEEQH